MASFFRKCIAQKLAPFLLGSNKNEVGDIISSVSSFVKVDKYKSKETKLVLSWKKLCDSFIFKDNDLEPSKVVRLLRNQGLPTAEGFIDIELNESRNPALVFTVDEHVFSKFVLMDISNTENLVQNSCLFENISQKKVLVACSSSAIGDLFSMTHFRSAIRSKFVLNINRFIGHEALHIRHIADFGLGAAIFLAGHKEFSLHTDLSSDPSRILEVGKAADQKYNDDLHFQEKVENMLQKMFQGDQATLSDLNDVRSAWMQYYDLVYKKMGLSFDITHLDSNHIQEIKKIYEQIDLSEFLSVEEKKEAEAVGSADSCFHSGISRRFLQHELSSYINAAVVNKEKHKFDAMYLIAPSSKKAFFKLFLQLLNKLGYSWSKEVKLLELRNIPSFDSKKMKGALEVLDLAKLKILDKLHYDLQLEIDENVDAMAENLGFSSLCLNDMKYRPNVQYNFLWKDVLTFGKHSAASLQFCYAGLKGLQEDSEYKFKLDIDTSPLLEGSAHDLIKHLSRFDEILYESYINLEPHKLYQYLCSLWFFTDRASNVLRLDIKGDRLIVIKARLLLLSSTLKVLEAGLKLLGLTPMENKYSRTVNVQDKL
ncbi:probable arginine--tRNA ligase, mitochondrial [Uloborus diversus]|uniref:probable arginine--tRNA ligase, mitochondrial n=1 Tax=Uloborus diversus TaxID=327109 RepID=UPI00240A24C2|nr:probable arginine--tRNA ligase, mitochondrial [Uloborus diversus]